MKNIIKSIVTILFLTIFAGCLGIGIPIGHDILSTTVLGKRMTQDGQEIGKIIWIEGTRNYYFIISVDGGGKKRETFFKFYLEKGGNRINLYHLPFTPQGYDVLQPVLPVQESTKWIAARLSNVERHNVDLELIVFDENKLYRSLVVKECVRTTTERWTDLFNYGVEVTNGNSKVIFHTNKGEYLFDVRNNTFEKK